MSLVQTLSLVTPPLHPPHNQSHSAKSFKVPLKTSRNPSGALSCSAPKSSQPATEQDIIDFVADFDGADSNSLPAVRTYENDLARLTLVGGVDFEQALTAAAADGGEAASHHILSNMPAMVVDTLFPGPSHSHTTLSTRLFLPTSKVKEKAKKLRSSLTEEILSSTSSKNILAMTFRQVVLQQLWNFELALFRPGMERNMEDLGSPREVLTSFTISSPDEKVISVLAEVVCLSALESTEKHFLDNSLGKASNNLFHLFHKSKRYSSKDSAVILYKLLEDEIVGNAKSLLEKFSSRKDKYKPTVINSISGWWTPSVFSKLEKIGGPEFATWASEYLPAYRLQIDTDKLYNLKFTGWKKSAENRWEILLTHSQMVCLANILDMYYEDLFTLPNKQLSCDTVAKSANLVNKRGNSLLKMLSIFLVGGVFLVTISVLGKLYMPHLHNRRKYPGENLAVQSSNIGCIQHVPVESTKLEEFCVYTVKKIKDSFGWSGEIMKESSGGAWIGILPGYLRNVVGADSSNVVVSPASAPIESSDEEMKASAQDIASYQVVLSVDGKIIGIQPTSRVAVNHWAANPLAKELYGGRKLSPGFVEPGLKINPPSEVVVLELLMSVNSDSYFALARPDKSSLPGA